MKTSYTRSMLDFNQIYWVYASKSQTNNTLVYARCMQRPFQLNLTILTAKNLAYAGHMSWYKINRFLHSQKILV